MASTLDRNNTAQAEKTEELTVVIDADQYDAVLNDDDARAQIRGLHKDSDEYLRELEREGRSL